MKQTFVLSECQPSDCTEKTYALLVANPTRSHHYIAQTEQRQHAFNLNVSPQNRNIYQWPRSRFERPPQGEVHSVNIENNLEAENLYTLSFVEHDHSQQYNLENWFNRHESGYEDTCHTLRNLPAGSHPLTPALVRIIRLKLLSILRNPLNRQDHLALHLRRALRRHLPHTSPAFKQLISQRPHRQIKHLLHQFQFTLEEYTEWLADLYGMLGESYYHPSLFERLAAALLSRPDEIRLILHAYRDEQHYCFLSDSGYCLQADHHQLSIGLNLTADMFLVLQINQSHWNRLGNYLEEPPAKLQGSFTLMYDQQPQRLTYNRLCARQAHQAVYGKSRQLADFLSS